MTSITAEAPHRICDIGGWTDTWFAESGKVVNIAVNPAAKVMISAKESKIETITFHLENSASSYTLFPDQLGGGNKPLLEMIVRETGIPRHCAVEITVSSEIPPGSSAGSSAAVSTALIGGMTLLQNLELDREQIAVLAHKMETEKLHLQSGVQDQYASCFGSISYLAIDHYPKVTRTEIVLPPAAMNELRSGLLLLYFGKPHQSSALHENVIEKLKGKGPHAGELDGLRSAAEHAYSALVNGNIDAFGDSMTENTELQRMLHPMLISADADDVIGIAKKYRCRGYKVNGAGGEGGSMTLLPSADTDARNAMISEILAVNQRFSFIPVTINTNGLAVQRMAL